MTDSQPPTAEPRAPSKPSGAPSPIVMIGIGLVAVALLVYGQGRTVSRLEDDVQALKDGQRQLASGLGDVKSGATKPAVIVDVSGHPAIGVDTAVPTLVEFSDYECPYCIKHFRTTAPQIESEYIRTGKIRYVFRDLPIDDNHPMAIRAHEAAHCADEQHKFWNLHPKLFSPPGTHDPASLEKRAQEAGLDMDAFRACISSGRTTAAIRASVDTAERLGADGTPAFYIGLRDLTTNKVRVTDTLSGAQPFSSFQRVLDEAIAEAGHK